MKNIKFILLLCLSLTLLISCGDNDDTAAFTLTNANIAGTYKISSYEYDEKETTTTNSGNVVELATIKGVADSFDDVNIVLNANGNYTASGGFRAVTTETPITGSPTTDTEIVVFNASGSYIINSQNNTITFNPTSGEFIEGNHKVITFTQNSVTLTQSDVDTDNGNTITSEARLGLVRK